MSTSNSENGSVGQYDSPFGTVQVRYLDQPSGIMK